MKVVAMKLKDLAIQKSDMVLGWVGGMLTYAELNKWLFELFTTTVTALVVAAVVYFLHRFMNAHWPEIERKKKKRKK